MIDHLSAVLTAAGHVHHIGGEAMAAVGRLGRGIVLEEVQPTGRPWNTLNPIRTTGVQITVIDKSSTAVRTVVDALDDLLRDQQAKRPISTVRRTGLSEGSLEFQTEEDVRHTELRATVLVYDVRWIDDC